MIRARLSILVLFFAVASCGAAQDVRTIRVEGSAMSPAIKDGDTVKVDKGLYKTTRVERFDIIVFRLSDDQKKFVGKTGEVTYFKRIVGMPNETVEIKAGKTFINGNELSEPFLDFIWTENYFGPVTIPNDEYFVLGDNRPNSLDSRYFVPATVKMSDFLGKVIEIVPAKK